MLQSFSNTEGEKQKKTFKTPIQQPGMQTVINCHYSSLSRAQIQKVKLHQTP